MNSRGNECQRQCWIAVLSGLESAHIDDQLLAFDNSKPPQFLEEGDKIRFFPATTSKYSEPIIALLRARRDRPHRRRGAAKQREELAALHSITSSARTRMVSGMVNPIALAVFRLSTSSNLVTCSTGRSAGFAPLRMRSTKYAPRRYMSGRLSP